MKRDICTTVRWAFVLSACIAAWTTGGVLFAQEQPADAPVPAAAETTEAAAERGPKAKEFYAMMDQWKELLKQLRGLKEEYATADETRQGEIEQEYDKLVGQGVEMQEKLTDVAIEAYKEAPNADLDVLDFLLTVFQYDLQSDAYERATELGKLMIDNDATEKVPEIYGLAGVAAFNSSQFDLAEEWFKEASPQQQLPPDGRTVEAMTSMLPYYKGLWTEEQAKRKAEAEADDLPRVLFQTDAGDITIELFENEAPNTVANIISLVEKGFYDDVVFHRVLPGFMAQGGDPTGTGTSGPGYCIKCECYEPGARKHFRGSLSMAHAGRDTGGSQFFLTFVPTRHLDGMHTVFGRVVDGMDVLAKLKRRDPQDPQATSDPSKIVKAKVLRKRDHEYKPETLPGR